MGLHASTSKAPGTYRRVNEARPKNTPSGRVVRSLLSRYLLEFSRNKWKAERLGTATTPNRQRRLWAGDGRAVPRTGTEARSDVKPSESSVP